MEYGHDHAQVYDQVFEGRGKDFEAEAGRLAELIRQRHPDARSLLDVACGTGAHLRVLERHFPQLEGIEASAAMQKIAQTRLPGRRIHHADMRDFTLPDRFDAVICVGNSAACLESADDLARAVKQMAAHLTARGVLIVEPWFFRADFLDGRVDGNLYKRNGRVVAQMTRFTREGQRIYMHARFVVADPTGFQDFDETLSAHAFPREDYEAAFRAAGLSVEFVRGFTWKDGRPTAPGLFIGTL
ncbi:class I SAM-dependent methyltransferase [Micromonospora sediminicola]|uniref:class I SAM-dependent methyltransferase n=1 Tax=Micromonospora sediminicola TaxID=946078 RepID=UPI0033EC9E29